MSRYKVKAEAELGCGAAEGLPQRLRSQVVRKQLLE
jgi:hypothetical protein